MKNKRDDLKNFLVLLILIMFLILVPSVFGDASFKPYLHYPAVIEAPSLTLHGNFQIDLWPGAATYNFPIEVPTGRNGLQPIVSINYNSLLAYQRPSIVGTGWTLSSNLIWRDVDYSFTNTSDDKFWLTLNGQQNELVYVPSENRFHTKIESYLYITNSTGGNNSKGQYWVVKTKDGTMYRFGYNDDSELVSNLHDYVTKWSLDLINDTHDNHIYYSYNESPTTNDLGAVYPYRTEYNNEKSRVIEFIFEDSDRPDKRLVYEQGNKIREARRIKEIEIKANGQLVRKYNLNYSILEYKGSSFLSSITSYGNDGISNLPVITFEYFNGSKGWLEDSDFEVPPGVQFEIGDNEDYGTRLADLNRDGLIDLLRSTRDDPGDNKSMINNGSGWIDNNNWLVPVWFNLDREIGGPDDDDNGVRLVDLNGDGFTDLVQGNGNDRGSWLNTGTGWSEDNSSWHLPTNANPSDTFSQINERGVRFVDFNNDGLVDILSATDDWNFAWRNIGAGWIQDNSWKVPSAAVFSIYPSGKDEGVRIADVNGDNLPDLIKGNINDIRTWLNNGSGWVQDSTWEIPLEANFTNSSGDDLGVRIADINGDGLADLLRSFKRSEVTFINNGSGWIKDEGWNVPQAITFVHHYTGGNKETRLVDMNGDGLTDIITDYGVDWSYTNKAAKTGLLKKILNNLGGETTMKYLSSSFINNSKNIINSSNLGFNLWVVESVTNKNGMNDSKNQTVNTDFDYYNGYYDYYANEFRGFNNVEEIKPDVIIEHWYNQSNSLKGKEYKTEVLDSNSSLFQKTIFDWTSMEQDNYYTNKISFISNYFYDGYYKNATVTIENYGYDNYGNIISLAHLGESNTNGDEKYEYWQYVYNTNKWIVDRLKNYTLFNLDNSTRIKEIIYRYDNLSYGLSPTYGSLSSTEEWLSSGENPTTNYSYDSYGNLIKETDARGFITEYEYGTTDTTHTFVDQITNAKNHSFNYNYDLGTGNLLSEIDSNGITTNYTYDVFGRILKEIQPYDSATYPSKEYEYTLDGIAPEKIKVTQREESGQSATYDVYYFYDGFGNLVQIKNEAEDGQQIVADLYYDNINRKIKQSNPYFTLSSSEYLTPNQSVEGTVYTYDALSRVIETKNPDNTQRNFTFERWKTTTYDENGNKQISYYDAYGQINKVVEYVDNNYFTTQYEYDTPGNLVKVNDSYSNIIKYTYDSLGRKIKEESPDVSTWQYSYDKNNNLINQTDNRSVTISMQYDPLNRVITKTSSGENTIYTYDADKNGTLTEVVVSDYKTNFTYDDRRRVTEEIKGIDEKKFQTEWSYDSADRIKSKTQPDNNIINFTYNTQGQLENISNILIDIIYNPFNLPTKRVYVNNLESNFTYNQTTSWLTKIKTGSLQDLNYEYDSVGNIKKIDDVINSKTTQMEYDKLNRLTSAEGDNFNISYFYDATGNLLKIAHGINNTLYYSQLPIHAPVKVTNLYFLGSSLFNIANSSRGVVAWFDVSGNLVLDDTLQQNSDYQSTSDDLFIIRNNGEEVLIVAKNGSMFIDGTLQENQGTLSSSESSDDFRIKTNGELVAYVNETGYVFLKGNVIENANS